MPLPWGTWSGTSWSERPGVRGGVWLYVRRGCDPQLHFPGPRLWFGSVQFSHPVVSDSATSWTTACQAALSITNSRNLLKPMSIELVMPSNHLMLCCPLLLLLLIFPIIRVFSNESTF